MKITYRDLYEIRERYQIDTDRVRTYEKTMNDVINTLLREEMISGNTYHRIISKAYEQKGYNFNEIDNRLASLWNSDDEAAYWREYEKYNSETLTDENLKKAVESELTNAWFYYTDLETEWELFTSSTIGFIRSNYFNLDDIEECVKNELWARKSDNWNKVEIDWEEIESYDPNMNVVEFIDKLADKREEQRND